MKHALEILFLVVMLFLLQGRAALRVWLLVLGVFLVVFAHFFQFSWIVVGALFFCYASFFVLFGIKKIRIAFISKRLFQHAKKSNYFFEGAEAYAPVFLSHSYFFKEKKALEENKIAEFDEALFDHLNFFMSNAFSCLLLGLSGGYLSNAPYSAFKHYFQKFDQFSCDFSFLLDVVLFFPMDLKKRQTLLFLLEEDLALLCLGSSLLAYLGKEEPEKLVMVVVDWICQSLLFDIQSRMQQIIKNFPGKIASFFMARVVFPYGAWLKKPSGVLSDRAPRSLLDEDEWGQRLIENVSVESGKQARLSTMLGYYNLFLKANLVERKLEKALQLGKIGGEELVQRTTAAVAASLISQEEADLLLNVERMRQGLR
ncbi:MAG: DUF1974 domain-containing protein [Gammaproteobacteria bacterium]|nr:DUF1974 domain-containing protein [Gammaproteobacteria bacterium]